MNATCQHCGKPLTAKAVDGLCPECLLKVGLGSGSYGVPGAPAQPVRFTPMTPEQVAKYFPELDSIVLIGQGGMGAVYKARQKRLDRFVALKILPPDIGHDPSFAERFEREAKALAKLNHPNIVTLFEFGQTEKDDQGDAAPALFYFLMEFVDGLNLRQLLRTSRIAPREALAIVPQICDALQYAHDAGIVHRDIKPENILLDRQGRVKVADFGLAKLVGTVETMAAGITTPQMATTEAGQIMGTPQYMAPEQREHPTEVDHRADIYSLGVVFYQMLTGELPQGDFAPPSKKVLVDVRLDAIVLRALEKKPELRYQQVSDVKTIVETIAGTPERDTGKAPAVNGVGPTVDPPPLARRSRLGLAAFVLSLAGLLAPLVLGVGMAGALVLALPVFLICELVALVLAIMAWRSGFGKAAVIIAAILSLLVLPTFIGILAPSLSKARSAASSAKTANEMHRVLLALLTYADQHNGMWPRHLSEANLQQFEQTYRYQPPQASNANVAATAILFELTATHAGDPYVGFADGHLERSKLPPHQAAPLTPTTQ